MADCAAIENSILGGGCGFSSGGGLQEVYLMNKSQLVSLTRDSSGLITAIDMTGTLKNYDFLDNTSSFDQVTQGENAPSISQTLNLQLAYAILEQDVKNEIEKLTLGRFYAIVKKDNKYQFVADKGRGLSTRGGGTNSWLTGLAETDESTIQISLVNTNQGYADFIDTNVALALLAGPAGTSGTTIPTE